MRATSRFDRDRHRTSRAVLRNWRGSWRRPFQLVHRLDDKENAEGDDNEINHERNKIPVVPSHRTGLNRVGGGRKCATTGCIF